MSILIDGSTSFVYSPTSSDVDEGQEQTMYQAQVSALCMCPKLQTLVVSACPASLLVPLLDSTAIASSLRVLKVSRHRGEEDYMELATILGSLVSLQEFHLLGGHDTPTPDYQSWKKILHSLPPTIRSLTFDCLDGKRVGVLLDLFSDDHRLPALEGLYLPYMDLSCMGEAASLDTLLKTLPVAKRLKTLHLHVICSKRHYLSQGLRLMMWNFVARLLGFDGDVQRDTFPSLETLILGNVEWVKLGHELLKGRLPKLAEVRLDEDYYDEDIQVPYTRLPRYRNWYEDGAIAKFWIHEVLAQRPALRSFCGSIVLYDDAAAGNHAHRLESSKYLFRSLSTGERYQWTGGLGEMVLDGVTLDDDLCGLVSGAIRSRNLACVKSLSVRVDDMCSVDSLAGLGEVVHRGFLPRLTSLFLAAINNDNDLPLEGSRIEIWGAFWCAIPPGGLVGLRSFSAGDPNHQADTIGGIFHAFYYLRCSLPLLKNVRSLSINAQVVINQNCDGIAMALNFAFPSLEVFEFYGTYVRHKSLYIDLV